MIPAFLLNKYTVGAIAATVTAGALWLAYSTHRESLIQFGYDKAIEEVEKFNNDIEREYQRERSRQVETIFKLRILYAEQVTKVDDFSKRQLDAERLYNKQKSDFDEKLKRASADGLREYAKAIDSNLEGRRGDVKRFSSEAASCSDSAFTLKTLLDICNGN